VAPCTCADTLLFGVSGKSDFSASPIVLASSILYVRSIKSCIECSRDRHNISSCTSHTIYLRMLTITIPSSRSNETIMAAPCIGQGGEDHQTNRRGRSARRGSCIGRVEEHDAPPQQPHCLKAKLAPPASDSIPRRPRRTVSPPRSETTGTTADGDIPAPVDDTCYGYEDMKLDQHVSECTQSSREILMSTLRKIDRRDNALGRLQQLQIMESDKSSGGQKYTNERAHSASADLFPTNTRRHHSPAAAYHKWSESNIRETDQASLSPRHNRRRMSVGDFIKNWRTSQDERATLDVSGRSFVRNWRTSQEDGRANLDISGRSSHSNPDANEEKRSSDKHSDVNVRGSRSSTDPSTWSSRSNPDAGARSSRHRMEPSSPRSSRSSPDLHLGDSHRIRAGRKKVDHRGSASLGQRQDGWNGQVPNQTPDTLTLDRLQGLAQMKLVRDQSKMSLISKESALSKDSQANRDYGIPWWS
jgi:hypothetical protein